MCIRDRASPTQREAIERSGQRLEQAREQVRMAD